MNQVNHPRQAADESDSATHWSAGWLPALERSGQRMQQLQHAAQDLQKTVNQESVRQIEDVFNAMSQISSAVNDAARENSLGGVFSAQPRVLECMMQITQKSNERLMRITERMNACTVAIANGEATAADPAAAKEASDTGSATHQSNRSGNPARGSLQGKQAAATQDA